MAERTTWHDEPIARVLEHLGVDKSGLNAAEAQTRLMSSGRNVLPHGRSAGPLDLIGRQLKSTLPLVLLASGLLALAFGKYVDGIVVVAVVVINAGIGAIQEFRAGRA